MEIKQTAPYKFAYGIYAKYFVKSKSEWSSEKRVKKLMDLYEAKQGYRFDIHHPQLFTEKIQWYKEFYRPEGLVNVVDKFLFKNYIASKLGRGYTLPIYGMWTDLSSLERDWSKLPETFVLKSNCQSDGNFIKIIHKKSAVNFNELKKELKEWLDPKKLLINSFCSAYHTCVPRILAEKYEENIAGQLFDYKVYCFSGEPYSICASKNHFNDEWYPITYYDLEWNKLGLQSGNHKTDDIEPPHHLEEILQISKKLSADFPFVRVDFFDTPKKLYLAEMTLYPGGGFFNYHPATFDKIMGDLFIIPENQ